MVKKNFSSYNKKYFVDPDRHNENFVTTNLSSRSHTFVMIRLDCISSYSVERSFSNYNNILSNDRQNLSKNSLRSLNMLYFNK